MRNCRTSFLVFFLIQLCCFNLTGQSIQEKDTILYISAVDRIYLGDTIRLKRNQIIDFIKIRCKSHDLRVNSFRIQGCNKGSFLIYKSHDENFTNQMKSYLQTDYIRSMLIDEIELINKKDEVIKSRQKIELEIFN